MLKITRVKIFAYRFLVTRNRTAITELNCVANGSNIQWRGRSYAASVPSDVPKPHSGRKRVSKDERKAMVEAFVKMYRAAHDGKFPTASFLRENVGGSYYVIRIMLQELEYKSKTSSADGWTETVRNEPNKEPEVSMDVGHQNEVDIVAGDSAEIDDSSDEHLKAEGSPLTSSTPERNSFEEVGKPTALGGQPNLFGVQSNLINKNNKDVSHSDVGKSEHEKMEPAPENPTDFVASERHPVREETDKAPQVHDTAENRKKEEAEGVSSYFVATESHPLKREMEKISHSSFGNADEKENRVLESNGTKNEAEQHKVSPESVKNKMDVSSRQTDEAKVPKKSTLWGNLKSLADDFFRMWK